MKKLKIKKEINDPNEVKVICDKNSNAISFSRLPIPYNHTNSNIVYYKQVCVIPFRKKFLIKYYKMKPTKYEIAESIDMMRIIENGEKVKMIEIDDDVISVDTPKDLKKPIKKIKKDNLLKSI